MRSAAFQAFLVVLGVVLALAANEWRQAAADRAEAEGALRSILEEIATNRAAVEEARAYHAEKLEVLVRASQDEAALGLADFDRGFVAPAQVADAAWRSAAEVGALAHLPYERVLELGRVYAQQDGYQDQQATVAALIYREIFESGPDTIIQNPRGLRALIGAFYYREQQLLATYDTTLGSNAPAAED